MQTFLPYSSFTDTARCLDMKRLGKQRVEAKQILIALCVKIGDKDIRESSWRNHPAVLMWKGYESFLCAYGFFICQEWISRGYKDSLAPQFEKAYNACIENEKIKLSGHINFHNMPPWFNNKDFHASHRSNLLRKFPEHYSQFGWTEGNDLPYVWPVKKS